MKKFSFFIVTLTILGMVAFAAMAAKDSDTAKVGFTLEKYFSLNVEKGSNVEFGRIDPLKKTYTKKNGSSLAVESNTNWSLSTSKKVLRKPNDAKGSQVLNALSVSLHNVRGKGDDNDIRVDYKLSNLSDLPAGDYVVEVTFTGSTK